MRVLNLCRLVRSLVALWVADWLLVSFYAPDDVNTGTKEVRAAKNSLERLTLQLHDMKREKSVPNLQSYISGKKQDARPA